jgi:hypothetical protein
MGYRIKEFPGNIAGSVFTAASSDAIKPPLGHVFVAFTVLTQASFDASGGLVAETATQFANTEDAAGDLAEADITAAEGSGGVQITNSNTTFPAGSTIYGRYTEIDLAGGTILAYYAKK